MRVVPAAYGGVHEQPRKARLGAGRGAREAHQRRAVQARVGGLLVQCDDVVGVVARKGEHATCDREVHAGDEPEVLLDRELAGALVIRAGV